MTNTKLGGIAVALIAVFAVAAYWYRSEETATTNAAAAGNSSTLIRPHSITLGPDAAPVTLVEFLDPECEACAAMGPIVKRVMAEFDGKVRLVARYMPYHGNSAYAAGLLEGARAQGKYWETLEMFFARQPQWASHAAPRADYLIEYIRELGLDTEKVLAVARDPRTAQLVQQDMTDGQALGVNRTPTFFVNGRVLPQIGYEPLRTAVSQALAGR